MEERKRRGIYKEWVEKEERTRGMVKEAGSFVRRGAEKEGNGGGAKEAGSRGGAEEAEIWGGVKIERKDGSITEAITAIKIYQKVTWSNFRKIRSSRVPWSKPGFRTDPSNQKAEIISASKQSNATRVG